MDYQCELVANDFGRDVVPLIERLAVRAASVVVTGVDHDELGALVAPAHVLNDGESALVDRSAAAEVAAALNRTGVRDFSVFFVNDVAEYQGVCDSGYLHTNHPDEVAWWLSCEPRPDYEFTGRLKDVDGREWPAAYRLRHVLFLELTLIDGFRDAGGVPARLKEQRYAELRSLLG